MHNWNIHSNDRTSIHTYASGRCIFFWLSKMFGIFRASNILFAIRMEIACHFRLIFYTESECINTMNDNIVYPIGIDKWTIVCSVVVHLPVALVTGIEHTRSDASGRPLRGLCHSNWQGKYIATTSDISSVTPYYGRKICADTRARTPHEYTYSNLYNNNNTYLIGI